MNWVGHGSDKACLNLLKSVLEHLNETSALYVLSTSARPTLLNAFEDIMNLKPLSPGQ